MTGFPCSPRADHLSPHRVRSHVGTTWTVDPKKDGLDLFIIYSRTKRAGNGSRSHGKTFRKRTVLAPAALNLSNAIYESDRDWITCFRFQTPKVRSHGQYLDILTQLVFESRVYLVTI